MTDPSADQEPSPKQADRRDSRSTIVGRVLFLVLAVFVVANTGQYAIAEVGWLWVQRESGASWTDLWLPFFIFLEGVAVMWGVSRDRARGDTTGGLGCVVMLLFAANLVLFMALGGVASLYGL